MVSGYITRIHHLMIMVSSVRLGLGKGERRSVRGFSEPFQLLMPPSTWMALASCHQPGRQPVRVQQRLVEIHDRYGLGHLVSRSVQRATPMILRAVEQVHYRAAQTKTT